MAMDHFVVPQFIEVEDKIFGPITVRQFVILLVAGLFLFLIFKVADRTLFALCALVIGGFAMILAFVKINGQVFHYFLLNIVQHWLRPALRIWDRRYTKEELNEYRRPAKVETVEAVAVKTATPRHIRDLSLLVNTGGYYKPE